MEATFESNRNTARIAGAIFLVICIPLSLWGQMYVPSKIFVPQNPTATALNLLSNEFIYRTSILVNIAGILFFATMTMMFYRIFKSVDKHLALFMIVPVLAQVPIVFMLEVFNFAALLILESDPRPGFDAAQQQETAYLLMRVHRAGVGCEKLFLGLSFIPWGMLVWRSGYLPRIFGVLLIISAVGYIADTSANILFERSVVVMVRPYLRGAFLGYLLTIVWLVIKGVRVEKQAAASNRL